jgi:hypothetical protein
MGRRVFNREFKLEAVRLVRDPAVSGAQAARELRSAVRSNPQTGLGFALILLLGRRFLKLLSVLRFLPIW